MIIDEKSELAQYTHIIDDYGHRRAFEWIDPIKKIGIELVITEICDHSSTIHKLEWLEDQPFPYTVMIRDPISQKEYLDPCIHDLTELLEKAKNAKDRINQIFV